MHKQEARKRELGLSLASHTSLIVILLLRCRYNWLHWASDATLIAISVTLSLVIGLVGFTRLRQTGSAPYKNVAFEHTGGQSGFVCLLVALASLSFAERSWIQHPELLVGFWLSSRALADLIRLRLYAEHSAFFPGSLVRVIQHRRKHRIDALAKTISLHKAVLVKSPYTLGPDDK